MKRILLTAAAAAALCAVMQSPAHAEEDKPAVPVMKSRFAPPPEESLKALRATVGRPFNAGYVFVDGKYLPPPYKVERYGTVIRINGVQVTRQVVPWEEFVKTQTGAKVVKSEAPAAAEGADAPAPAPEPAPAPVAKAKKDSFDDDASLDDLFDDAPKARSSSSSSSSYSAAPRPKRQPAATVSYVLEGTFAMNEKAKALLNRVNDVRTRIDKQLRSGGYYCFSSRYSVISGDSGAAKRIIERLPEAQKNNPEHDAFVNALNRSGLSYLPLPLMNDFFKNRLDFLKLAERKKADQNQQEWSKLLNSL